MKSLMKKKKIVTVLSALCLVIGLGIFLSVSKDKDLNKYSLPLIYDENPDAENKGGDKEKKSETTEIDDTFSNDNKEDTSEQSQGNKLDSNSDSFTSGNDGMNRPNTDNDNGSLGNDGNYQGDDKPGNGNDGEEGDNSQGSGENESLKGSHAYELPFIPV